MVDLTTDVYIVRGSCEHCGEDYVMSENKIDLNTATVKCPRCKRRSQNWTEYEIGNDEEPASFRGC